MYFYCSGGACDDCMARIPYATLIATIMCCLGVGVFCLTMYRGATLTNIMLTEASVFPWKLYIYKKKETLIIKSLADWILIIIVFNVFYRCFVFNWLGWSLLNLHLQQLEWAWQHWVSWFFVLAVWQLEQHVTRFIVLGGLVLVAGSLVLLLVPSWSLLIKI